MKKTVFLVIAGAVAGCGSEGFGSSTATTAAGINAYLEGKTLLMEGNNIPTDPNGFSEDMNLGPNTQCYHSTQITIGGGTWNVNTELGTLNGAPTLYSTGTCDRTTVSGSPLSFTSTTVLIENVQGNGACFDITVTYTGFSQEGRAAFSTDGKTLTMELFFGGQATGHRCADGAVGAATVTLNGHPFTGNAKQIYVVQ